MKNITLSADEGLIEAAREPARAGQQSIHASRFPFPYSFPGRVCGWLVGVSGASLVELRMS